MAQKTNLNVSPYFDDFDSSKEYYKVLFSPGRAVQARELNNLQSQIQYQIEKFGSHFFKDGSMVIPGGVTYDSKFYSVKLKNFQFGVDLSVYINNFIGKKIFGRTSGVGAVINYVALPSDSDEVDNITIYVKYIESGNNNEISPFLENEQLYSTDDVTYGNTTISGETSFATTINENATSIGSAAHINRGVYFIRGFFVEVPKQTIILDYYTNTPSYKVGFTVNENIVNAKADNTLYDNANGFTNYSAPGADRFSISLSLDKRPLSDEGEPNFIEFLRTDDGDLKKEDTTTQYSIIRDYLARRTYDESGDYSVTPFQVKLRNSLNNYEGNLGVFFPEDTTDQGNIPSDDLCALKISPGVAYVAGYDIAKTVTTILDVEKPRETEKDDNISVLFKMGNYLEVNNLRGSPEIRADIGLYLERKNVTDMTSPPATKIGDARLYNCQLTDQKYQNAATSWNLYLYDIQTYTNITLNDTVDASQVIEGSYIKGSSSGASGYTISGGSGGNVITLRQTSGRFQRGESILIDGIPDTSRSIDAIVAYSINDIKSVYQNTGGTLQSFSADTVLERRVIKGFSSSDEFLFDVTTDPGNAIVTSPGRTFRKVRSGDIISYTGDSDVYYNVVSSVSADLSSITLSPLDLTVTDVANKDIGFSANTKTSLFQRESRINSYNDGSMYVELPTTHTSSVDLSSSILSFKAQTLANNVTTASGTLTLDSSNFDLSSGISTSSFQSFDEESYSLHYQDRTVETLTADKVSLDGNGNQITFTKIDPVATVDTVIGTLIKRGVQSKVKVFKRGKKVEFAYSKYPTSGTNSNSTIFDGLEYNQIYGLRVQDEEICLGTPDVVRVNRVLESLDQSSPVLDQISFSSLVNVFNNVILGEKLVGETSNASALVISKPNGLPNNLEIVYLNDERFIVGENIKFEESEIVAPLDGSFPGEYKDVTTKFRLKDGQKDQYYDYSRLVRKKGETEPSKKLVVIFDHYIVPENDTGDVYTALSYNKNQYQSLIPRIGRRNIRAYDVLDFRPRVPEILDFSTVTSSPFDFSYRNFEREEILAPDEVVILSSNYYLGRVDRLFLNRNGEFVLKKGISSINPKEPQNDGNGMLLATIIHQPYLENPSASIISLESNKRYTMKDIGNIEGRLSNLEETTLLSLLEVNTEALKIKDGDGLDQFKTGFFVDNFDDDSLVDPVLSTVEFSSGTISAFKNENTLPNIADYFLSLDGAVVNKQNETVKDEYDVYRSKDGKIRFSGDGGGNPTSLTLDYEESIWITQPVATRVENVNPFHVIEYTGNVVLSPKEDRWTRTELKLPAKIITKSSTLRTVDINTTSRTRTQNRNVTVDQGTTRVPARDFDAQFGSGNVNGDTRTVTTGRSSSTSSSTTTVTLPSRFTTDSSTTSSTVRKLINTGDEKFMRRRNVLFEASNLKPFTKHYQFLDNQSKVKQIPKLLEVNLSSGSFVSEEDVIGYKISNPTNLDIGSGPTDGKTIKFRLARPNHKYGPINNPTGVYDGNPYDRDETLPSSYSGTLQYLNVDTYSLSDEKQGEYIGALSKYVKFVGQTSGAVAYLKDNRLITDAAGDLQGCFFLTNPNRSPAPLVRIETGTKTYKLTSSKSNEEQFPGSTDISSGETTYTATGVLNTYQDETTNITTNLITEHVTRVDVTTLTTTRTTRTATLERYDPLAQSFEVGRTSQAPQNVNSNIDKISDSEGAFLTAVDIFFRTVDSGNSPVTIQVRSMELGTPTLVQIGESVTLKPNQVVPGNNGKTLRELVSENASVPCRVIFPYPIYLPPDDEYAIVLLAPESVGYEVFIAEMNESSLNEEFLSGLSEAEKVKYSKQFAIGSLFKSQNGSIWTADQNQDLKFNLYKAKFVDQGVAVFKNPVIDSDSSTSYFGSLEEDPITIYPRKLSVGITTTSISDSIFSTGITTGRKITEDSKPYIYGYLEYLGGPTNTVGIDTSGENYDVSTNVDTFNYSGNGTGLTLDIDTVGSSGDITGISINSDGNGYRVGDVVGIVTSSTSSNSGFGARITITAIGGYDTLYLNNVQGESFSLVSTIQYFDDVGAIQTAQDDLASDITVTSSTVPNSIYSGNIAKVKHFNHGMYSTANLVSIANLKSDEKSSKLTDALSASASAINLEDSNSFVNFEGYPVSGTNIGYVIIENEIISYTGVVAGTPGSLTGITRGIDSTISSPYEVGQKISKYELGGISLRRLNLYNVDIAEIPPDLDSYYLEFRRSSVDGSKDRSNDFELTPAPITGTPQISFKSESAVGGNSVTSSQNLLYSEISPSMDVYSPGGGKVNVEASARMITGTSVGGNEKSFNDLGFVPIQLNRDNKFLRPRLISSRVNETERLSAGIEGQKSLTMNLNLTSSNPNLSPQIFIDNTVTKFGIHRLNNPVSNYITDRRANEIDDDSHSATYVSSIVNLQQPSTSLKVLLSAYRNTSADFRVLYSLVSADSFEVDSSFTLFPGYKNLTTDRDLDGFLDVRNESNNSGLPDTKVRDSQNGEFLEYEYSASGLQEFVGFSIKIVMSGTNQAQPPRFDNIRVIALA